MIIASTRAVLDAEGNQKKGANGYGETEPCELKTIKLSPVYANNDPKHENTKFWQSSPSGSIELGCVNAAASEQFKVGKEYYIDFTPA